MKTTRFKSGIIGLLALAVAFTGVFNRVSVIADISDFTETYSPVMITQGRNIIDAYRNDMQHTNLKSWEHAPYIEKMEEDLRALGFKDGDGVNTFCVWDEFNTASELRNVKELGFLNFVDFEQRGNAKAGRDLDAKWH